MLPETHGPGANHQHAVTLAIETVATVQVARSLLLQDFEYLLVLERQNILKILGKNWHIVFEILKKKYRNLDISITQYIKYRNLDISTTQWNKIQSCYTSWICVLLHPYVNCQCAKLSLKCTKTATDK